MLFMGEMKLTTWIVLAAAILTAVEGIAAEGNTPTSACAAEKPFHGSDEAPLGSPDFYPSAEHPIGWRGDGTGRFPGATPPTVWNRRVADITSEIMVQAAKPKGKPGPDSHVLEYFTVKDWLVAGPFAAPEPEKDIDNDFLGGEAVVEPDAGAKAGDKEWKVHRAYEGSQAYHTHVENTCTEMWVDLVYALGTLIPREKPTGYDTARYANLDKQAAYAHTYLYAPHAADVELDIRHELPVVKMWLNGTPQRVAKGTGGNLQVHLNQGWNRLLIKAICDQAQTQYSMAGNFPKGELGHVKWRFAVYIRPASSRQNYSGGYETKNIAWMLKLPAHNASQPIVVGSKVFVGGGDSDLFCIDKECGKILWLHTGTYWDAMNPEERAAVKSTAEPLLAELEKTNADLVTLLNANITPQGLDASRQTIIDQQLGRRKKFLKSLHDALSTGTKGKLYLNQFSAGDATPTSDGKQLYWVVQGIGGYLTSAFDLNGKLIWSNFEFQKTGVGEHGAHHSPLLFEEKLFVSTSENLIARDVATGKELWRVAGAGANNDPDRPIVVQYKGRPALQTPKMLVSLDGEVLVTGGYSTWECYVPIVENGVLYNSSNRRGEYSFETIAIPRQDGDKHKVLWKLDAKTLYGPLGNSFGGDYIASPLYVDGLVYQVDSTGNLVVIDANEKNRAYQHMMDGYNVNGYTIFGYCASPTLAGKNIYLLDDCGCMTILKPGSGFTRLGTNIIQNITNNPGSAPCKQEVFYAGMWFDGARILLHGDEYLYCIKDR